MPATVFVSVGHVLSQRPYWWDELQQLLLRPGPLPETLSVTIGGVRRQWFMGDSDTHQRDLPAGTRTGTFSRTSDPSPRHAAYRELCAAVRELPPDQQETVLDEIRSATSACAPIDAERGLHPGGDSAAARTRLDRYRCAYLYASRAVAAARRPNNSKRSRVARNCSRRSSATQLKPSPILTGGDPTIARRQSIASGEVGLDWPVRISRVTCAGQLTPISFLAILYGTGTETLSQRQLEKWFMPDEPHEYCKSTRRDDRGGAAKVAWDLHRAFRESGLDARMAVGWKSSDDPDIFAIENE